MTGDDHGNGGTAGRFDSYKAASPAGCSVGQLGVRAVHLLHLSRHAADRRRRPRPTRRRASRSACTSSTNCADWTPPSLESDYTTQLADFAQPVPRASPRPVTQPHALHRLERLGDPAEGRAGERHAARHQLLLLAAAAGSRTGPGFFTGSGMPMRFADTDGTLIDVYQAATQMTDESGQTLPVHHRHAARQRARAAGLLRRVHREHAHRLRRSRRLGRDRRLGQGARRAGGLRAGRCSPGSTAATARRFEQSPGAATTLSFTRHRRRGRERPPRHAARPPPSPAPSRASPRTAARWPSPRRRSRG